MTTRIVVTVRPDGTISAETRGLKGPACLDEVSRIEALCGAPISESQLTAEYMEAAGTETKREASSEILTDDHPR